MSIITIRKFIVCAVLLSFYIVFNSLFHESVFENVLFENFKSVDKTDSVGKLSPIESSDSPKSTIKTWSVSKPVYFEEDAQDIPTRTVSHSKKDAPQTNASLVDTPSENSFFISEQEKFPPKQSTKSLPSAEPYVAEVRYPFPLSLIMNNQFIVESDVPRLASAAPPQLRKSEAEEIEIVSVVEKSPQLADISAEPPGLEDAPTFEHVASRVALPPTSNPDFHFAPPAPDECTPRTRSQTQTQTQIARQETQFPYVQTNAVLGEAAQFRSQEDEYWRKSRAPVPVLLQQAQQVQQTTQGLQGQNESALNVDGGVEDTVTEALSEKSLPDGLEDGLVESIEGYLPANDAPPPLQTARVSGHFGLAQPVTLPPGGTLAESGSESGIEEIFEGDASLGPQSGANSGVGIEEIFDEKEKKDVGAQSPLLRDFPPT
ncbi:MAG: hypothetical protein Q4D38_09435 [Planctomycetia bacterium]|nr:hypothetical protein [Planctomycetia bacterium]